MRKNIHFLDRFEDKTREHLSTVPILYAIIGGITIVIFWRGIWVMADRLESLGGIWTFLFDPLVSVIASIVVLLATGLFVSFFIGDRIILSGLKHEKKVEEKTESEVREEETLLAKLHMKLDRIEKEISELKSVVKK